MRMPDRLQWSVDAEPGALPAACPPMSAAHAGRERRAPRHRPGGGGRAHRRARCRRTAMRAASEVTDTGVGLSGIDARRHGLVEPARTPAAAFGDAARLALAPVHAARHERRTRPADAGAGAMSARAPTALIADDEPLLRNSLVRLLAEAWPELEIVAQARNGREAVERFEALQPDVCFLDVHMPGLSGVEAARAIGRRAQLVFVTAYDQYAVQAFEQGALDYLVKPVERARLADTVARLQARLRTERADGGSRALLQQLSRQYLRWLRASVGNDVRLIAVEDIDYLRSDEKYTRIAWRGETGKGGEALVRTPLEGTVAQLDPAQFVQVHRAVVVNLRAVSHVVRGENETGAIASEVARRRAAGQPAVLASFSGGLRLHRVAGGVARGPGPLEVVAAEPAGDVDHFADEIQARARACDCIVLDDSSSVSTPPSVTSAVR